jgi:hypothetical protein
MYEADDGHKQITPFFFAILSISYLGPIIRYKVDSSEGVIKAMKLSFAALDGLKAELAAAKHSVLASQPGLGFPRQLNSRLTSFNPILTSYAHFSISEMSSW